MVDRGEGKKVWTQGEGFGEPDPSYRYTQDVGVVRSDTIRVADHITPPKAEKPKEAEPRPWELIEIDEADEELANAFSRAHLIVDAHDRKAAQDRFRELALERYPDQDPHQVFTAYLNASEFRY